MSNNNLLQTRLTAAKAELEKVTLLEKSEGWNLEKYRPRRIAAERAFLTARLQIIDANIEELKSTKNDLVRAFKAKYPKEAIDYATT